MFKIIKYKNNSNNQKIIKDILFNFNNKRSIINSNNKKNILNNHENNNFNYNNKIKINNYCTKPNFTFTSVGNIEIDNIIKKIENEPKEGPLYIYNQLVKDKKIKVDPYQISTVKILQNLYNQLKHKDFFKNQEFGGNQNNTEISFSKFLSFFNSPASNDHQNKSITKLNESESFIKGIYLYGDVGCGKSFLMDLFYNSIDIEKKKRIHFHHFMLDVHKRIHKWRQTKKPDEDDPIPPLSRELVKESWLLCFDEFQVTDVSDAMILKRLFSNMFDMGAILVTTSNRAPSDLYKNGLNRQLFVPFIHFLEGKCIVHNLNSGVDYRLTGTRTKRVYYLSNKQEDVQQFTHLFKQLTKGDPLESTQITLSTGRKVHIPRSANSCAIFDFKELCDTAMGADDYIEIAKNFHTIFLENIPMMNESTKNQARRFIILIDVLYEHKVKLICTAQSTPGQLFMSEGGDNSNSEVRQLADDLTLTPEQLSRFNGEEERFMFSRAVSRIVEMQSDQYLSNSINRINH
ncbi:hypothetical protein DICPUDRAFT_84882 [Dictyostelium purpureum]|uniref:ATPase n=1 Tax=Dictyostelium purpureum TaxID=5786 RepID=F1A412_DICPU|nr:uncharacterized protein DICPUDRAFT_84882 [Dictyostelium purpureum]EGC29066.1 hypothetical protein DICPUDRAFT_84882 [Dictyostelium purpureum]|eukprot:XP_003294406.1 hypothetical protein DICPUDRAFT_84882 [Dictyostelium purpureum]